MDLIATLIQAKEKVKDATSTKALGDSILEEIITYDKLSKSPKFRSILENPTLQKKLPNVWQAFNGDIASATILTKLLNVVAYIKDQRIQLLEEFADLAPENDRKQKALSKVVTFNFVESPLELYISRDVPITVLREQYDEIARVAIIQWGEKTVHINYGQINITDDGVVEVETQTPIGTIEQTIDGYRVQLHSYSKMGNNNRRIATILNNRGEQYNVSIKEDRIIFAGIKKYLTTEHNHNDALAFTNSGDVIAYILDKYIESETNHAKV